MNDLEKHLWRDREIQDYLQNVIAAHSRKLLELQTPRADAYNAEFAERAKQILQNDVIDGRAVYDLLMQTGGADYALDLYRKFRDYLTENDSLPEIVDAADELKNPPPLADELVHGILRKGHQLLLAGGSKTSKSFLVLELALAVALGEPWLDTFDCEQGRVLYVNGEIDRASCDRRIMAILDAKRIDRANLAGRLDLMPARGSEITAAQLAAKIRRSGKKYSLIILDPLYTLADVRDENNAAEVRGMLREIGTLATETGAALVEVHHHSKGQQGQKRSIDRAAGSGVFGRWFDGILDLSVLNVPDGVAEQSKTPDSVAMRIEADLRDFKNPKPFSMWWRYPVHIPDVSGELDGVCIDGDPRANLKQFADGKTPEQRQADRDGEIIAAIQAINRDGREPTIKAVADEMGVSDRAVRKWLEKSSVISKPGKVLEIEHR